MPLNIASRGLLPGAQAGWLEPRRRELADIRLQALEVIGRAGLRIGGAQLTSAERGGARVDRVRALPRVWLRAADGGAGGAGNVAEGMRVFERLRTLLRDELGTAPSPEAIAAHERLLRPGPAVGDRRGGAATRRRRSSCPRSCERAPTCRWWVAA